MLSTITVKLTLSDKYVHTQEDVDWCSHCGVTHLHFSFVSFVTF